MTSTISKKICLIGDFGVGKTSLIRRFVDRQFSDAYLSTIGVKISRKTIELSETESPKYRNLQLLIWDIEGNAKFKSIAPTYLRGAAGAIIVGDVTRQETLDRLSEHIQNFLLINPQGLILVALNKLDLIDEETLARLMQQHIRFNNQEQVLASYATSAKTGKDVDQIFQTLAYNLIKQNEFAV